MTPPNGQHMRVICVYVMKYKQPWNRRGHEDASHKSNFQLRVCFIGTKKCIEEIFQIHFSSVWLALKFGEENMTSLQVIP